MKVKVKLFALYKEITGTKEIELDLPAKSTVLDLIKTIAKKYPQLEKHLLLGRDEISDEPRIILNGRNIEWLKGSKTELKEGDTIALFPPAAGGINNHRS